MAKAAQAPVASDEHPAMAMAPPAGGARQPAAASRRNSNLRADFRRNSVGLLRSSSAYDLGLLGCWFCKFARRPELDEEVAWAPAAALLPVKDTPGHRSLRRRAFAPLTAGGIRQSTFTLVQTALGGGVLTMAYMMRLSGVGLALLLLLAAALVAYTSMDILMRSAVRLQIFTFSGLMIRCMGPRSGPFLDVMLFFFGNGAMVAFFIFLGSFMPDIVLHLNGGCPSFARPEDLRALCMAACCVLAVPMSLPKNISALRFVSPFALVGLFWTVGVVAWHAPALLAAHLGQPGFGAVRWFNWEGGILRSFSICIFAFNCHINVVPVASEMVNPTTGRISKTNFRVVMIQIVVYVMIACCGYVSFLATTPQNVLAGYDQGDRAILASRSLLSVTLLACIAINAHPSVRSLMLLLEECFPQLREHAERGAEPLLAAEGSEQSSGSTPRPAPGRYPFDREGLRHLLSVTCVTLDCYIAVKFQEVAVVIGVLGASVGTLMMMVIPAMLLVAVPDLYSPVRRRCTIALLSAAAAAALSSLVFHG